MSTATSARSEVTCPDQPYDGLVKKRVFEMPVPYVTAAGGVIKNLRVGYECIGRLNAEGTNAILIPHPFYADSHFAGRYAPEDELPGYWDAIVGPGKPLDTDKYFLISVDTLCNVFSKGPTTVTTGPSSIDPDTGRPYGMSFPVIQYRDFVTVQKAVLEHLGVTRLHAVMGASMGAGQALEWAAVFPEMVDRVIAVIPAAGVDAHTQTRLRNWREMVMLDPKWNNGDYYDSEPPVRGLTLALKQLTLDALSPAWGEKSFGRKWADPARDPLADFANDYAIYGWVDQYAGSRINDIDANNFLYLVRTLELFVLGEQATVKDGMAMVKAPALILPSREDCLLPVALGRQARDYLTAQGNRVEYMELEGPFGHLNGVMAIGKAAELITRFLTEPA